MTIRRKRIQRPQAACAQASIPASDMNDDDEEVAVFCRQDGDAHDLPYRHHVTLARLRREPDFAGLVITDAGKVRCPRCEKKLDWRPTPKVATITPLRIVR